MNFSTDLLRAQLQTQPLPVAWQVAFSGGLDSSVLLHAMAGLRGHLDRPVGAVHVHHGLQAAADAWTDHCQTVCITLDLPLTVLHVDARPAPGESPEAAARQARYAALADWLAAGHCLLTAQHRDDQAETLLLQLLRGAGVHGLAGMPVVASLGRGQHLRPLLPYSRRDLQAYAVAADISWFEEPSNSETGLDRNFLRHEVLPVLKSRWPALSASLSRSAAHAAEAAGLLDELASADLQAVEGRQAATLSVAALQMLAPARRRNVLRLWMKQQSGQAPSTAVLERVLIDMLDSREDAEPRVCWGNHELRRYRDGLFALPVTDSRQPLPAYHWQLPDRLELAGRGVLTATRCAGEGLRRTAVTGAGVDIRWRAGGEVCQPAGRAHHHALKKLFQEAGIPPWQRDRIPLLYIGERLAAVAGLWVCDPFQAGPGEDGYRIQWQAQQP